LASSPSTQQDPVDSSICAVSAVPAPAGAAAPGLPPPVARTTFLLVKHSPLRPTPGDPAWEGNTLRYGQRLLLMANPMAQGEKLGADLLRGSKPLYLVSRPVTATTAAKLSRHQLVAFTAAPSFDAVWETVPIDPLERARAAGRTVMAGDPLLLVHVATRAPLCLEATCGFLTADFGVELEISTHLSTCMGMQQGLEHAARVSKAGGRAV
jgi:hypothetical protein